MRLRVAVSKQQAQSNFNAAIPYLTNVNYINFTCAILRLPYPCETYVNCTNTQQRSPNLVCAIRETLANYSTLHHTYFNHLLGVLWISVALMFTTCSPISIVAILTS